MTYTLDGQIKVDQLFSYWLIVPISMQSKNSILITVKTLLKESGNNGNLSPAENSYNPADLESQGSKFKVPV